MSNGADFFVGLLKGLADVYGQRGLERLRLSERERLIPREVELKRKAWELEAPLRQAQQQEEFARLSKEYELRERLEEKKRQAAIKAQAEENERMWRELTQEGAPLSNLVKKDPETAALLKLSLKYPSASRLFSIIKQPQNVSQEVLNRLMNNDYKGAYLTALRTGNPLDLQAVKGASDLNKQLRITVGKNSFIWNPDKNKWESPAQILGIPLGGPAKPAEPALPQNIIKLLDEGEYIDAMTEAAKLGKGALQLVHNYMRSLGELGRLGKRVLPKTVPQDIADLIYAGKYDEALGKASSIDQDVFKMTQNFVNTVAKLKKAAGTTDAKQSEITEEILNHIRNKNYREAMNLAAKAGRETARLTNDLVRMNQSLDKAERPAGLPENIVNLLKENKYDQAAIEASKLGVLDDLNKFLSAEKTIKGMTKVSVPEGIPDDVSVYLQKGDFVGALAAASAKGSKIFNLVDKYIKAVNNVQSFASQIPDDISKLLDEGKYQEAVQLARTKEKPVRDRVEKYIKAVNEANRVVRGLGKRLRIRYDGNYILHFDPDTGELIKVTRVGGGEIDRTQEYVTQKKLAEVNKAIKEKQSELASKVKYEEKKTPEGFFGRMLEKIGFGEEPVIFDPLYHYKKEEEEDLRTLMNQKHELEKHLSRMKDEEYSGEGVSGEVKKEPLNKSELPQKTKSSEEEFIEEVAKKLQEISSGTAK